MCGAEPRGRHASIHRKACRRVPDAKHMPAKIIDGVAIAAGIRSEIKSRAARLTAQGRQPGLAVILVGSNPASRVYVRNKIAACREVGIRSDLIELPIEITQAELLRRIDALNADPGVHGLLIQLPLPAHIEMASVLERIAVEKD